MKKRYFPGILVLILALNSCSSDSGDFLDSYAQPPTSKGGPGGVWVDSYGDLRIDSTIYNLNSSGELVPATSLNGKYVGAMCTSGADAYYPEAISNGAFSTGIWIYDENYLEHIEDLGILGYGQVIESGAGVKVAWIEDTHVMEEIGEHSFLIIGHIGLLSNIQIAEETSGGESKYVIKNADQYGFFYSAGDISLSGTFKWNPGDEYSNHVDVKLTKGWNVVIISSATNGDNIWESKNPLGDAKWVVLPDED